MRLRSTTYRTRFFLNQIATGNWDLKLPLTVHGVRLAAVGPQAASLRVNADETAEPEETGTLSQSYSQDPSASDRHTQAGSLRSDTGSVLATAASNFDRIDGAVTGVVTRTDRAKSLWTTVIGTLSQALWAVFGFVAGLPREVWIVVALIAAALMLLFLYRQIVLGRIRENLLAGNAGVPPARVSFPST